MTQVSNSAQAPGAFSMTAPNSGGGSNRRDDVQLVPAGPNPCILYAMVDMGTHHNAHFNKDQRKIRLTYEFPLFKQLFREDDTEPKPTVLSRKETFLISESSNLKKLAEQMLGRALRPDEYQSNNFNIGMFLGQTFIANVQHQAGRKDPTKMYAEITSLAPVTEHSRSAYNFDWNQVTRTNDLVGFAIDEAGACFQSDAWIALPKFLREEIMKSKEAIAYAGRGGTFRQPEKKDAGQSAPANAPAPVQRQPQVPQASELPIVNGNQLVMIATDFPYVQYREQGWTDDQLVQHQKAKWVPVQAPAQASAPAPAPSAPAGPPAPAQPSAPAPASTEDDVDDVPF